LMVSALVRLYRATQSPPYLDAASQCAQFLLESLANGDAINHTWTAGHAAVPGFLSDYALLSTALLDLYESTFDVAYLRRARELAAVMTEGYYDDATGVFNEAGRRNEKLVAPISTLNDEPVPSGCSAACHVLLRLGALFQENDYFEAAQRALRSSLSLMRQAPLGTAHMLSAALRSLSEPREFVIVGLEGVPAKALCAAVDELYLPHVVRAGAASDQAAALSVEIPLLEGKKAAEGRPTAYVCSAGTCHEPVQQAAELKKQLVSLLPKRVRAR